VILIASTVGGCYKFQAVESDMAELTKEKLKSEIAINTEPVLLLSPTVERLSTAGDYRAIRIRSSFKNSGQGSLELGTLSIKAYSATLPIELEKAILKSKKDAPGTTFAPVSFRVDPGDGERKAKITPVSTFDFKWNSEPALDRNIEVMNALRHNQETSINLDYVVRMPSRPTWFRFTITAKPTVNAEHKWEERTVDAVVEFSTLSLLATNPQVGRHWTPVSSFTPHNETSTPDTGIMYVPTPIAGIRPSPQEN
jgi:hypothetical protein